AHRRRHPRGPPARHRPRAAARRRRAAHGPGDRRLGRRRRHRRHRADGRGVSAEGEDPRRRRDRGRSRARRPRRRGGLHAHDARGAGGALDPAAWRPDAALEGRLRRRADPGARDRLGQGRGRQVVRDRQPGPRPARDGPRGRRDRRRHLRVLDPRHARRAPAPGDGRPHDRAARRARPEGHVDRLLPRRGRRRHVAWSDAAQGPRAVHERRALGLARLPARRHAARHGRRRHLAGPAAPSRRGADRDHAAGRRPARRRAGGRRRGSHEDDRGGRDREHVLPGLPVLRRARRRVRDRRRQRPGRAPGRAAPGRDPARAGAARGRGRRRPALHGRSRVARELRHLGGGRPVGGDAPARSGGPDLPPADRPL
ncbi:MAG: Mrp protein homolog, partial [uncultured Thermoleophilia bacterium]